MALLTYEAYRATFAPPMVNVTDSAEEVVDLWSYADPIIEAEYHNCTAWNWRVAYIYQTSDGLYQHIGIPVPQDNTYLVVIVDMRNRSIMGHWILELEETASHEPRS